MRPPDGNVFSILGDDGCRAILDKLAGSAEPLTQRQLIDELGIKSPQISRQMKAMEDAGLVARARPHSPYTLLFRERIGDLLELGAELAAEIGERRFEEARIHANRRREGRVRAAAEKRDDAV